MKKLIGWLAFGVGVGIGASLGWYIWMHLSNEAIAVLAGMGCASGAIILVISALVTTLSPRQQEKAPSPDAPLVG